MSDMSDMIDSILATKRRLGEIEAEEAREKERPRVRVEIFEAKIVGASIYVPRSAAYPSGNAGKLEYRVVVRCMELPEAYRGMVRWPKKHITEKTSVAVESLFAPVVSVSKESKFSLVEIKQCADASNIPMDALFAGIRAKIAVKVLRQSFRIPPPTIRPYSGAPCGDRPEWREMERIDLLAIEVNTDDLARNHDEFATRFFREN